MITQNDIDYPGRAFRCTQDPISLGRLCRDIDAIPSVYLVRVAEAKGIKVSQAQEGRVMKGIGKVLLVCAALYFTIHLLVFVVKG